jgi:hypothetical protein
MELETNEKYNICTAQQMPTCSWIYIEMGEWEGWHLVEIGMVVVDTELK